MFEAKVFLQKTLVSKALRSDVLKILVTCLWNTTTFYSLCDCDSLVITMVVSRKE
jgi:hypothetical protein